MSGEPQFKDEAMEEVVEEDVEEVVLQKVGHRTQSEVFYNRGAKIDFKISHFPFHVLFLFALVKI